MICFSCDNEEFTLKQDAVIEQEIKGEVFKVESPAFACTKCGWLTLDADTTDELRRRTADAYRKKHGLLMACLSVQKDPLPRLEDDSSLSL